MHAQPSDALKHSGSPVLVRSGFSISGASRQLSIVSVRPILHDVRTPCLDEESVGLQAMICKLQYVAR